MLFTRARITEHFSTGMTCMAKACQAEFFGTTCVNRQGMGEYYYEKEIHREHRNTNTVKLYMHLRNVIWRLVDTSKLH